MAHREREQGVSLVGSEALQMAEQIALVTCDANCQTRQIV